VTTNRPGPTVTEFLASMATSGGCWPWPGHVTRHGYGTTRRDTGGHLVYVHRVAYELTHGPIPEGLVVDHLCHVAGECMPVIESDCPHRRCLNPVHLEAKTQTANTLRGNSPMASNAQKDACPSGHELAGDNCITLARGGRRCRACHNASQRARERRKHPHRGPLRGEANQGAKLTEAKVHAIRADSRSSTILAAEYGVSAFTIQQVRNRKKWAHVA
jgi:hypothetical protein